MFTILHGNRVEFAIVFGIGTRYCPTVRCEVSGACARVSRADDKDHVRATEPVPFLKAKLRMLPIIAADAGPKFLIARKSLVCG
jgi:hypothetical protein